MTAVKLVVAAWLLGLSLAVGFASMPAHAAPSPTPAPHVEEDEPGWDCYTMGNRSCGPRWAPDQWPTIGDSAW